MTRLWRCWVAVVLSLNLFAALNAQAQAIPVLHVNGVINTGSARYIERGIEVANHQKAALLVIVLNTPGGLLNSTRQIVQAMGLSQVPIAVYVSPSGASATSAGTIITMAAHYAAMAPGTNIGAAHPVGGQGEDIKGDLSLKAVNDTVAFIKSQATLRGRNAEWAEQAIRKSVSATADEATRLHVVDWTVNDLDQFLLKIDARGVKVAGHPQTEITMTVAERFLAFIGDPNVSYLLMVLGGLGLYAEISAPGTIFPGVFGTICLILSFISLSTLPVNYGAVALLVLGLLLFILEAFVTSYGVLTVGGVVSIVLGGLFLMDGSTGDLKLSLALLIPTVLALGVIIVFIGYTLLKSKNPRYPGLTNFADFEGIVQQVDVLGRSGKCLIRGEVWNFETSLAGETLAIGDHVKVTDRKQFRLIVTKKSRGEV